MDGISTGIVGLFVATWAWIATLTYKVGRINGDIKDKVDLMFAKMFKDTNNGEIAELRNKIKELESMTKLGSSNLKGLN